MELFRDAVAVIERDYSRDIDLGTVAAEIATSRRQLQRVFAEVGGTNFRAYLSEVRMRHALELLKDGMPVGQVARRVGHGEAAQFRNTFRRHYGASPSSFRPASANGDHADRLVPAA
jgi:AraC family transcriptional regulator of adaptative response / methylphosphotriester-DNA alkyltransferase methyltransferase